MGWVGRCALLCRVPLSFSVVSKMYRVSTMDGGVSTWDGGASAIDARTTRAPDITGPAGTLRSFGDFGCLCH